MKTKILSALLLVILLSSCSPRVELTPLVSTLPVADQPRAGQSYTSLQTSGKFEKTDCSSQNQGQNQPANPNRPVNADPSLVECGTLTVPEKHDNANGPQIKLAVMVAHSQSDKPQKDPLLLLMFGPSSEINYANFISRNYPDREVIALDQRGVGRSEPALSCAGISQAFSQALSVEPYSGDAQDAYSKAYQSCFQQWTSAGINLQALTSKETVADIEDLRQALGYQQWNIYATGYGAQIALGLMQNYPQAIRSVVIDSPGPLSVDDYASQPANAAQALDQFFNSCAADTACNGAFPDLKRVFYDDVDQLDANPASLEVNNLNTGDRYQVLMDGYRLIDFTLTAVTGGGGGGRGVDPQGEVPRMLFQIKSAQYSVLARLLGNAIQSQAISSVGMQYQVTCGEVMPLLPAGQPFKGGDQVDQRLLDYYNQRFALTKSICAAWQGLNVNPAWPEVAASSIPTLIIYGPRSVSSAPGWSQRLATMLSRSIPVEIASKNLGFGGFGGFGQNGTNCQQTIVTAFLADPTSQPDTTCAADKPPAVTWITLP